MKFSHCNWVEPFNFTGKEKEELLLCWKRAKDKQKAIEFISACENHLTVHLARSKTTTKTTDKRDRYHAILKTAKELKRQLDRLPADCSDSLDATSKHVVFKDDKLKNFKPLAKKITGAHYPGIKRLDFLVMSVIDLLIISLEKAAKNTSENVNKGPKKPEMLFLVGQMKKSYERIFEKPPSNVYNSPFYLFIKLIEKKFKWTIGEPTIKAANF